eukprot:2713945-Prymnesium_polylepis.1
MIGQCSPQPSPGPQPAPQPYPERNPRVPPLQVNTPTYNRDLADATKHLIEVGASGLFNVGGPDVLGRAAFAD